VSFPNLEAEDVATTTPKILCSMDCAALGTSNVHFAMKHNLTPVGTVAHEWFMGVAAITNDYEHANEIALQYWTSTFGEGVLAIALTDTFGTPAFLRAFKKPLPAVTPGESSAHTFRKTYAQVFTGVRQDSGDPLDFVKMMREFYDQEGIKEKKTIVFSDSLNIDLCLKYRSAAEAQGFQPSFGVGTFLTSKCPGHSNRKLADVMQMTLSRSRQAKNLYR
jgi:nicotinate phosphoribosyltransferase